MQTKRAKQQQLNRLKQRIYETIKHYDALFLTMTLNDSVLAATNEQTRLRYVKEFLQKQCDTYILNKDYGKTTDREHYHAIIRVSANNKRDRQKLLDLSAYKYGKIKAEYIKGNHEQNAERLTTHTTKNSTRNSAIIYSRKHTTNKTNYTATMMQANKRKKAYENYINESNQEIDNKLINDFISFIDIE